MDDTPQEKETVLTPQMIEIIIPQCCREGWESCPHVIKQTKKTKENVGL